MSNTNTHGLFCLIWLALAAAASGQQATANASPPAWNQFRGPNGSGVALASQAPIQLGSENLAWKVAVPAGISSPVLAGNRIYLTAVEGGRLITLAFDAVSGKQMWRQEAPPVPLEKVHEISSPAAATPLADDQRVYVYFGSYGLLCYDHDGREQWKKAIPTPKSQYGMASSPISHGEHLILVLDNDANLENSKLSQSRMVALKNATGEVAWETARPLMRSAWSTPMIWSHGDGHDLVVLGSGRVCGYDPDTGVEKWFATGFSRETIALPVAGNGCVYVLAAMLGGVADESPDPQPFWTAMLHFDANKDGKIARDEMTEHFTMPLRPELPVGHPGFGIPLAGDPTRRKQQQAGFFASLDKDKDGFWTQDEFLANMKFNRGKPLLMAIRPGGHGDVGTTQVAWQLHQGIPEIPSPLLLKDRLYLVRNGGVLTAVDAVSGEIVYSERLGASGQYSAAPVAAGDHLFFVSNRGLVSVVKAGDTFQKVHQYNLAEPVFATPALDDWTIYIRTATHLHAYRVQK